MNSSILSQSDLKDLTGYARAAEQRRVLDDQGIPYKTIGSRTIVLASHVSAWIEGRPVRKSVEPDFSMVR